MNIQIRNPNLKYPLAIRDEKTLIELDWLLEFRFSTSEILATRIGQSAMNINRFLNTLLRSKLVQSFSNNFISKKRLYMLTSDGIDFLESHGRDIEHATTRQSSIGKYTAILHDLCVQNIILQRLPGCNEVIFGRHLSADEYIRRPDALIYTKDHSKTAIDYIYLKKSKERIYDMLYQHAQAVKHSHYSKIEFIFNSNKDMAYYQMLFNQPEWPRYKHIPNSSKLKRYAKPFAPKLIPELKKAFSFKYEKPLAG